MGEPVLRLRVDLDTDIGDPYERARVLHALKNEIRSLGPELQLITHDTGDEPRQRDLLILGALLIAIAPPLVSKLLDLFIHFMERNKGVTIELSIRSEKGSWIKLRAPYTSSPEDVAAWAKAVQTRLGRDSQAEGENKAGGA